MCNPKCGLDRPFQPFSVFTILYLGGRLPAWEVDVSGAVVDFIRSSGGVSQSSALLMFLTNRESPGRLDGIEEEASK